MPLEIRIKRHADIELPQKINVGDWIDLRAAETVTMQKGELKKISLGVSMELPKGYEAHIMPRSSTAIKFGVLMACSGIIDNSYCGDGDIWQFAVYAIRDTAIYKGDRICQFRLFAIQPALEFVEVECLNNPNRGGYGSTGTR